MCTADIYYTSEGLEKCNRQRTENRQKEKPITEATLIPINCQVEQANNYVKFPS